MTFTSAPGPLEFKLDYRRVDEFVANTCAEPVGEHIQLESKVVGPRDECPRTLELVSEHLRAITATSRSGPTTVGALSLPELDTASSGTGGSPDTHPDKSSNVDEQANCDALELLRGNNKTGLRRDLLGRACPYPLRRTIRRKRNLKVCSECRRRKKKCDRVRPNCSGCNKSGRPCYYPPHSQNSSSMSIVDSQPATLKVVNQLLTPITQTMSHEIQQSPGQYPSALWGTLAEAAATYDASVAEVDGNMKPNLLGYSNLSENLGESTLCRLTTSSTDCVPILTGPRPWFVEEPSYVVNNDAVPDSRVIIPPGYVEFVGFTRNNSVLMEGVAYGGEMITFAQVAQPRGQESSLWSPSGSDSTTVPDSLWTIAMPAAAAIPPITLSNPRCFEPTHFYGQESSQHVHPDSVSPFSLTTDIYSMPNCFL